MLLEGDVEWTPIFAVLAATCIGLALMTVVIAVLNDRRSRSALARRERQIAAASAQRLHDVLNAIPVALVQTDTDGRFIFANRAAHQLLGRRDAALLGLRFHSATWGITFPDGRQIPPEMMPSARALRGQTVKGFQHLLANPSTRRRMLVSVSAMPIIDDRGQVVGSTAAIVETEGLTTPYADPTETTGAGEAGEDHARRLEDIGRLTSGLAQDFSSLLAVMTSALEMVSDQAGHPEKVRRLAEAALGAGRRGEALTRRMAALTAGDADLPDQPLDAAVLLRSLEGRLQAAAGSADLSVSAPLDPTPVHLDPVDFEAAATALVANAVEAGARSIAVSLEPADPGVRLIVRDDGAGMVPDVARRATEPFFTTRTGSAGLGLAQVQAFARRSGGDLMIDSTPGQGTGIVLELPGAGSEDGDLTAAT